MNLDGLTIREVEREDLRVHRASVGATILSAVLALSAGSQPSRTQVATGPFEGGTSPAKSQSQYQELRRIFLNGVEQSAGIALNSTSQRLFVPRRNDIGIVDLESGQIVGEVPDTSGVVTVVLAPEIDRGFAASVDSNTITAFELKSLSKTAAVRIPGREAKNLAYDPATRRLFAMNNRSQSLVALSVDPLKVLATIPLVDDPESAVSDGRGRLYVVLADPAEIAVIDTVKLSLLGRLQLSPCNEPRGIALDEQARRLFVGCSNGLLVVLDPDTRKLVARLPVEQDTGDVALDAAAHVVFAANAAGTVSVISEEFPDKYHLLDTIPTARGGLHIALDARSHQAFVPVPKSLPQRKAGQSESQPASAEIIVIGRS